MASRRCGGVLAVMVRPVSTLIRLLRDVDRAPRKDVLDLDRNELLTILPEIKPAVDRAFYSRASGASAARHSLKSATCRLRFGHSEVRAEEKS